MPKTYKDLDIYKESFDLFIRIHKFSLKLPQHELYELGSQVRRSSDSVNSNIVEGYGRRKFKKDFIKYLLYSKSSNNETINHLRKLEILYPEFEDQIIQFITDYDVLGAKIYKFIKYVELNWNSI